MRKLKGLEGTIGLSAVGSSMGEDGWAFYEEPGVIPDTVRRLPLGLRHQPGSLRGGGHGDLRRPRSLGERARRAPLPLRGSHHREADWCLFLTLVRFDAVYYTHFKCNLRRIVDYPNLWGYLR